MSGNRLFLPLGSTSYLVVSAILLVAVSAAATPFYDEGVIVQAGGVDLQVGGYSVPTTSDWDNDGLFDLVVGEGDGTVAGKVRVYYNTGTPASPFFSGWTYAQTTSGDLTVAGSGCMGLFPRVVDWNEDGRKDLLIGTADGNVMVFLNLNVDSAPLFDAGTCLQVGLSGQKIDINVGVRATPSAFDWDHDGAKDLICGAYDGRIRWYRNTGTNAAPDFTAAGAFQNQFGDLVVTSLRSSPVAGDFDGDGRQDLICGATDGKLYFYTNEASDTAPVFGLPEQLTAGGVAIDLEGTPRSRPCICDWNGDGCGDMLVGASDGLVHLFIGLGASPVDLPPATTVSLEAPFPNPFNPQTSVSFTLERDGLVDVSVFDPTGRKVATLVQGLLGPGRHTVSWTGRDDRGGEVASGVYFVRLEAGAECRSRKITLIQ